MTTSVQIENLSKRYRLGLTHTTSVRDLANGFAGRLIRRKPDTDHQPSERKGDHFWALKDINFSIREGDTVGIIGRNGAGKSTLLKILSRITSPTTGRVELNGRVASLLEVGTGFHPELTGRENLYLNGTILGMTRAEVNRQFDAIVSFAGVEKFIDTPVKRYSSGMKVRLGFAVAAHLDPEILIVDEVLAVGDLDFQRKCLGKMDDVAKSGRTIIFVSHNMAAVSQLCKTGVVLSGGTTDGVMPISEAIDTYIRQSSVSQKDGLFLIDRDEAGSIIREISVQQSGANTGVIRHDQNFDVEFSLQLPPEIGPTKLSIAVCDRFQKKIFTAITDLAGSRNDAFDPRPVRTLNVRGRFLMPGNYSIVAGLLDSRGAILDQHHHVCPFRIENVGDDPILSGGGDYGVVFGEHEWLAPSPTSC
ncbi:ABC transporter ATP-binding protein [Roseiconus nitratireducens]|nr:polysaccharide ABC transporter ATP-binding protein [Roseiconus nitratireducens]